MNPDNAVEMVMPSSLRDTQLSEHLVPKVHWLRQTGKALRELDRYERERERGREREREGGRVRERRVRIARSSENGPANDGGGGGGRPTLTRMRACPACRQRG